MMVTVDLDTLEQMMRRVLADVMAGKGAVNTPSTGGSASYAMRAAIADEDLRRKLAKKARKAA